MAAPKKKSSRSRAPKKPEGARPPHTRAQRAAAARLIRESGVVITEEMMAQLLREVRGT